MKKLISIHTFILKFLSTTKKQLTRRFVWPMPPYRFPDLVCGLSRHLGVGATAWYTEESFVPAEKPYGSGSIDSVRPNDHPQIIFLESDIAPQ